MTMQEPLLKDSLKEMVNRQNDVNHSMRRVAFQLDQFHILMEHAHKHLAVRGEGAEIRIKGRTFKRQQNSVHRVKNN
ncbi:MAG: hypothetical protein V1777_04250 [Candidatus Micrarchaeota archaeon]